jgi:1,4-dihydroxy-2-naphthoate octaprenyltransferase
MNKLRLFLQTTRARTLPVMIFPVVIGAALAWQQGNRFQWGLFALTLLGALAAHLGANVINDVFDFGAGADQAAQHIASGGETVVTGSQFLLNKQLSLKTYRLLAVACFAVALLCGVVLSFYRPFALLFGALGFLLAFFYVAPPLRLAYIGRGLGEHGARIVGALLLLLIAVMFVIDALLEVYPWYSFIAALTIIPVQLALRKATGDLKHYLQLMAANFNGNLQAALLVLLALLIRGVAHV